MTNNEKLFDKARKLADKDQPYIDRYPVLKAWLFDKQAQCLSQDAVETPGGRVTFFEKWYILERGVVLVEVRSHGEGWEVWTSPTGIRVDEYLAEVDRRLEQRA